MLGEPFGLRIWSRICSQLDEYCRSALLCYSWVALLAVVEVLAML